MFVSLTNPRFIIELEIANEMAHTKAVLTLTPVFDLWREESGERIARYRSKDIVDRCRMDDVHIKTSEVT